MGGVAFRVRAAPPTARTQTQHPAGMTDATCDAEERSRHGFTDGWIRLSVGREDFADLRSDFLGAWARI